MSVIVDIHGHRFEVYTLISDIHENVNLLLEGKILYIFFLKLEGIFIQDSHI